MRLLVLQKTQNDEIGRHHILVTVCSRNYFVRVVGFTREENDTHDCNRLEEAFWRKGAVEMLLPHRH